LTHPFRHSREGGNLESDALRPAHDTAVWIPACAGMTEKGGDDEEAEHA
jgi:hypothetical protein